MTGGEFTEARGGRRVPRARSRALGLAPGGPGGGPVLFVALAALLLIFAGVLSAAWSPRFP